MSERNIIARLREGIDLDTLDKGESLDEKTYTIGDTQYWKRSGKFYSWTQSGGRVEISEDEYRKAIEGGPSTTSKSDQGQQKKDNKPVSINLDDILKDVERKSSQSDDDYEDSLDTALAEYIPTMSKEDRKKAVDRHIKSEANISKLAKEFSEYYNGKVTKEKLQQVNKNDMQTLQYNWKQASAGNKQSKPQHLINANFETIERVLNKYNILDDTEDKSDKELQNIINDITSFYKEKGKSKAFINNEVEIKKLSYQIEKAQKSGDDDTVTDLRKKIVPLLNLRREY